MTTTLNPQLVISNTTPVATLIRIQHLHLLEQLFGSVVIPMQAAKELDDGEHVLGIWRQTPGSHILTVETPLDGPFLRQLMKNLDDGEAAAIALAIERKASLLLMDELQGRKVAAYHGISLVGTLGILIEAKQQKYIQEVRPLIHALERINFRMSTALKLKVLAAAGEKP